MHQAQRIELFCTLIWDWYLRHKRTLPWRDLAVTDVDQKAYMILVSEVMLQQTQVSRVILKWQQWLSAFPTLQSLATASNKQVIMAWEGMGYNSRALRLRDMAASIITEHKGHFPQEYKNLIALKGIGPYTAAAVRNFAFGQPTACIDTNIRRILHRTFYGPEDCFGNYRVPDKDILCLAEDVLNTALSTNIVHTYVPDLASAPCAEWHAALMDFGSLVFTKINPKWDVCPLTEAGINLAAYCVPPLQRKPSTEPGRTVGTRFVPNRIFRGKIVQCLREQSNATIMQLGPLVCRDWQPTKHKSWLQGLLHALVKDHIITKYNGVYALKD